MRALDIMTRPAVTVTPDVPIREAAALLVSHGFTALPVVDDDQRMVGIVTEADLLHSRYSTTSESPGAPVGQVMTTPAYGMGADFVDTESQRVVIALAEGVLGVATASVRTGRDFS